MSSQFLLIFAGNRGKINGKASDRICIGNTCKHEVAGGSFRNC